MYISGSTRFRDLVCVLSLPESGFAAKMTFLICKFGNFKIVLFISWIHLGIDMRATSSSTFHSTASSFSSSSLPTIPVSEYFSFRTQTVFVYF